MLQEFDFVGTTVLPHEDVKSRVHGDEDPVLHLPDADDVFPELVQLLLLEF